MNHMICANWHKTPAYIYGPYHSTWNINLLSTLLPDVKMDQFSENLFSKKFKDKGRTLR